MPPARWRVLPHGPLVPLGEALWTVAGALPGPLPLGRRMVVLRLGGGQLLVHSAIALEPRAMQQLEALGEPGVLVVPNGQHRLDAAAYRQRYPKMRVFCPAAARRRVEAEVAVDGPLEALPADKALRVEALAGMRGGEAALVVRPPGDAATIIFCDALVNLGPGHGLGGLALRALVGRGLRVGRAQRPLLVRDAAALAHHLRQLAAEPELRRLVVGHGDVVEQEAGAQLLAAAARL